MLTSQTLTTWERPGITSLALMYSWVHRFFQTANESVTPTMTGLYPADYSTISGLALFPRTANDHLVSAAMVKKFTSQTSNVKGFLWTCLLFYRLRDELKLMSVVIDTDAFNSAKHWTIYMKVRHRQMVPCTPNNAKQNKKHVLRNPG